MGDMTDFCIEQEERKSYGEICYSCGCPIEGDSSEPRLCFDCIHGDESDKYDNGEHDWMPQHPKD